MLYKPKIMAPCYQCADRWTDGTHRCHDSCQRYMDYRIEMEGTGSNIRRANNADHEYNDFVHDRKRRYANYRSTKSKNKEALS